MQERYLQICDYIPHAQKSIALLGIDNHTNKDYIRVPTYELTLKAIGIGVGKMRWITRALESLTDSSGWCSF